MVLKTSQMVSMSEAKQDFGRVTKIVDKNGQAVVIKNNKPRYIIIDIEKSPVIQMSDDEKIDFVAKRIMERHKAAFLELAKW